jgi:ribosomal protein S20
MPRTKTAKKALRQNSRKHAMNIDRMKKVKTAVKTYKKLIAEGKKDEAQTQLKTVYKAFDKSAKSNTIKKGKANRMKSRLAKKLK